MFKVFVYIAWQEMHLICPVTPKERSNLYPCSICYGSGPNFNFDSLNTHHLLGHALEKTRYTCMYAVFGYILVSSITLKNEVTRGCLPHLLLKWPQLNFFVLLKMHHLFGHEKHACMYGCMRLLVMFFYPVPSLVVSIIHIIYGP